MVWGVGGYLVVSGVFGVLGFFTIPNFLDAQFSQASHGLGVTSFAFAAYVFINIHHYFIDSVIWRGADPDLSQYLVKANQVSA